MNERFFVDRRAGIMAVRDRRKTDPSLLGLHYDTPGVVRSWCGNRRESTTCPTCKSTRALGEWYIREEDYEDAVELCNELNAMEEDNEIRIQARSTGNREGNNDNQEEGSKPRMSRSM